MVVGAVKTLIIGSNGMLGSDLCKVFPEAITLTHKDLDITNKVQVLEFIQKISPDIVINAAAYTNVDGCEDNPEIAFRVNGYGPGNLAEACNKIGAKLVHFSTDYVFDGSKDQYKESDIPSPINVYGQSKLLGEQEIMKNLKDYRIIRISWLFGKHGKNFVEAILKLSHEIDEVKVVNDQFGRPTYTLDLAHRIKEVTELEAGIYHLTNDGICSWYEFASAFISNVCALYNRGIPYKSKTT